MTPFACSDQVEEASVISGEFVVACGDRAEVFDLTEEALDQIALFVDRGIKAAPCRGCGAARDDRFCACGGDGIHSPLPVITPFDFAQDRLVSQNMTGLQPVEQRLDLRDVVALAACQDEADGVAQGVGGGPVRFIMDPGGQTIF